MRCVQENDEHGYRSTLTPFELVAAFPFCCQMSSTCPTSCLSSLKRLFFCFAENMSRAQAAYTSNGQACSRTANPALHLHSLSPYFRLLALSIPESLFASFGVDFSGRGLMVCIIPQLSPNSYIYESLSLPCLNRQGMRSDRFKI